MPLSRRALAAAALALPLVRPAAAQTVARPARILVGFAAGGANDVIARVLAERLAGGYAPTLVVENRTGASGRIAMDALRAGDADGTLMVQTPASVATVQPHLSPNETRFDIFADFAPVTTTASFPYVLAAGPGAAGVTDMAGLLAEARRRSGLAYGTPGIGTGPHLTGIQLQIATGLDLSAVPYRGGAASITDLVGGQIPISINVVSEALPHHQAGRIRILATSAPQRLARLPEVPTFAELGFGDATREDWFGVLLPARTPAGVVAALNAAIGAALRDAPVRERLETLELAPLHETPQAFAARIRRDFDQVGALVRAGRITPS
jgi:tripartite-type tricarboxylate transporter receptor subunit TctC